jgi:membrane fusion protein (multidrug efflux system)
MSKNERNQTIFECGDRVPTQLEDLGERSGSNSSTTTDRAKFRLKHKTMLVASLALVIATSAASLIRRSVHERTDDARIDGHVTPVSARINGQVQQVKVIEGQLVHAGDVLAVMDQRECSIAVTQAVANVAYTQNTAASMYFSAAITVTSAYGGLNSAQVAVKNAEIEVVIAEHKLKTDEAVLKQAQADATAMEPVLDATTMEAVLVADEQELIEAQEKLGQAMTNLRAAQTAPQQVSIAKVKAEAADSQVMESQSQLEQAQLRLSYTIIRAPVTGIIGKRSVEVGQNVTVGQELMDVVSLDDVWITANFKETQLARLRPGQPVEIKVDAYGRTWKGHVTNLGGATGSVLSVIPSKAVGNHRDGQRVPVRIDFDRAQSQDFNAAGLLKPGLSAKSEVRVRWVPRVRAPAGLRPTSGSGAL